MADTKGSKHISEEAFETWMAEIEGLLPKGFAEKVEKDFTGPGQLAIVRRLALAYLEIPFRENVEKVETDREFAISMVCMERSLEGQIEKYQLLLDWLKAARMRMCFSVAVREDMDAVIAEAKRRQDFEPPQLAVDNTRDGRSVQ